MPTSRGTENVLELAKASQEGYKYAILFIVQILGYRIFVPNIEKDPDFNWEAGVQILVNDKVV
jgi:DNA-binding sugar fermentation-stimulating protein